MNEQLIGKGKKNKYIKRRKIVRMKKRKDLHKLRKRHIKETQKRI